MSDHTLLPPDTPEPSSIGESPESNFADALSQRYLAYALSTITARSLPDVRDGLKPVHRRLLYAMRQLKLDPKSGFKKSARVVGDVMGKFHPHGDAAIYEAMVRLAQEFAMRYPLVDGQGNFGNVDGDNAAAMRYTEARMSRVAELLMDGLDKNAVDFRPTYDGEEDEPVVMPAAFPNLLANGAQGIAVGMATSIPPHNILELLDAALYLLDNLDDLGATITKASAHHRQVAKRITAPDFPTGGVLIDEGDFASTYKKGRGSFRLRAAWAQEKKQIVVTAIPYQVQKTRLIEKIADLMQARKLPFVSNIQDESAEDVRIVIEPRSSRLSPHAIMENLYRLTDLETRVPFNLNVLDRDGTPGNMSLAEAVQAWLVHRQQVLIRMQQNRLAEIKDRLEVLAGYLIVYLNLDKVIAIIRNHDQPKAELMQAFKLNDRQATAILDMRLRSLRKLEEMELRGEDEKLRSEQKQIKHLLDSEEAQRAHLKGELAALQKEYGGEAGVRLTAIDSLPELDSDPEAIMTTKEAVTIVCSEKGWIRAMKGRIALSHDIRFKEGDAAAFHLQGDTTDRLLIGLANGRFFTIGIDRLPGGRGLGEPLALMLDMPPEEAIVSIDILRDKPLLLVASTGRGFIASMPQLVTALRRGKQVMTFGSGGGGLVKACDASFSHAAFYGNNHRMLIVPTKEIKRLNVGRGNILQKHDATSRLVDAVCFNGTDGLVYYDKQGKEQTLVDFNDWIVGTLGANKGKKAPKDFASFRPKGFG